MKNMLSNCLGAQFWGKMLTRISSKFFFGHWAKTCCPDSNMFLPRKWKSHCTDAEDHFLGDTLFEKRCNRRFLGVCPKNCQTTGESFPAELSKLPFSTPEEQCGFMVFLKKISAQCFPGFWVKNSATSPKKFFNGLVKTAFFVSRVTFSMRNFFL